MDVLKNGEIYLYGFVGMGFFEDGFTALDVAEALATLGRKSDVTVRLNSGGGIAAEALAIKSLFKDHPGQVKIIVDSVAASAASLLAMGGDQVIMKSGSMMMIHDPSGITVGNSEDHQKTVEGLETMANSMAEVYADKTGKPVEDMRQIMIDETWMTAAETVEQGFADSTESTRAVRPAPFDYRLFRNAPDRVTALADKHGWTAAATAPRGATQKKGTSEMTAKQNAKGGNSTDAANEDDLETRVTAAVEATFKARDEKAAKDAKEASDAAAAAGAKAGGSETPEQMTARIRSEEQKRHADITAACALAGKPEKAAAFVAEGKSLSDVVAELQTERAKSEGSGGNRAGEISARQINMDRTAQKSSVVTDIKASWDKQTTRLNKRHVA